MSELQLYHRLLQAYLVLPVLVFAVLLVVSAPYGRHVRKGWGPEVDATWAWVVMEAASPITFAVCLWLGRAHVSAATLLLGGLWQLHYLQRAFIFPFLRRGGAPRMPLVIAANALVFNLGNAYLNGRWLYHFAPGYPAGWLADPRLLGGVALFLSGFVINLHADAVLRRLRAPGETGYKIPRGGLYRWISAPNYFGEILEWCGWALCTWSLPGLAFALWTAANLVPRALANHRWYREKFPDYPRERRAIIPHVL